MKLFYIISGCFIVLFMCLVPLKRKIVEYDTQKNGHLVTATIVYIPNCFGSKIRHFLKFKFEDQTYSKETDRPCEDYRIGQQLILKHKEGTDIFLYQTEKVEKEFIATAILAIFGLFLIIYGFKRKLTLVE